MHGLWMDRSECQTRGAANPRISFTAASGSCRPRWAFVVAGLVKRVGDRLYNAAVLIDPHGEILLVHRKINKHDIAQTCDPIAPFATHEGVSWHISVFPKPLALECISMRSGMSAKTRRVFQARHRARVMLTGDLCVRTTSMEVRNCFLRLRHISVGRRLHCECRGVCHNVAQSLIL